MIEKLGMVHQCEDSFGFKSHNIGNCTERPPELKDVVNKLNEIIEIINSNFLKE